MKKCYLCKKKINETKDVLGYLKTEYIVLRLRKNLGYSRDENIFIHWSCYLKHASPDCIRQIVEFVRNFNPRLFYRNPKNLIGILKDFKGSLEIGE